ncbi:MAG: hypothetical protein M3N41_12955 [Acidobacteriota bacterium]|nr:hypothetical protein [Acidobacteriota bacterium]
MDSGTGREAPQLTSATSSFVLAAAVTVLFSTALTCVKDAFPPLKDFMKALTGHDWTTHGAVDLVLFIGLGLVFMRTKVSAKIAPGRLTGGLIAAVGIAGLGLALWFAFV